MAFASDIRTGSSGSLAAVAHNIAENFRKARAQRRVYRQTVNELSVLSDRELNDLGISACQIRSIAREAAQMVR
ncbi:MAG: hypothetical protein CSA74_04515 [Rhodobacterales bacterium]|nr:MAG: hypothetical protein CSA74_04515 [Rhodobacterales bacterium]